LAAPLSKGVASTFVNMYTAPSLAQTRSTDPWSRRISVTTMSRLMLNLRDPKILILTSRRTTEASTAVPNHMVTTYLDPNLLPTTVHEEPEEEVTSPIGESGHLLYDLVLNCYRRYRDGATSSEFGETGLTTVLASLDDSDHNIAVNSIPWLHDLC
jgi:hypothetical protein